MNAFLASHCARCSEPLSVCSMSRFNTDILCPSCLKDEQGAPGYQFAHDAESAAVRAGDYNFPGVGLSPDDSAFLLKRRQERGKV